MEDTKRCPFCGEEILKVAIKCKHCKSNLDSNGKNNQKADSQIICPFCGVWALIFSIIIVAGFFLKWFISRQHSINLTGYDLFFDVLRNSGIIPYLPVLGLILIIISLITYPVSFTRQTKSLYKLCGFLTFLAGFLNLLLLMYFAIPILDRWSIGPASGLIFSSISCIALMVTGIVTYSKSKSTFNDNAYLERMVNDIVR